MENDTELETENNEQVAEPALIRPDGLPDKFWNDDAGEVRMDALIKSYRSLENRMGADVNQQGEALESNGMIPETPAGYDIDPGNVFVQSSPEINEAIHKLGLTQDQAQGIYALAESHLAPLFNNVATELTKRAMVEKLTDHFGGPKAWKQASEQMVNWSRNKMPEDVFNALTSSIDGVKALQKMMERDEPTMLDGGYGGGGALSEQDLHKIMEDPRYWRDGDPSLIRQVREGFQRLYPD